MYRVFCDNYLIYDPHIENLKIISPKLDLEVNKTGSFEFEIYTSNPYYDRLQKLKSIITVYQDGELIFRGRILNDEEGFYNQKRVSCEGELAFLLDSIQRPYDFHGTPADLFRQFITAHNSQVDESRRFIIGNITVTDPNDYIYRADSTYLNTWDSITKKLIDGLGGYLNVRHESDGIYIDYLADFNVLSSQIIEFGKNLIDIKKITKGEEIATAIIPLGAKNEETGQRITIKSVNDDIDFVYNQEAVNTYGWIFKTVTWDNVTLPQILKTKGLEYVADSINLQVSIELTAFDLSAINVDINSFKLGTYIRVRTSPHNINSNMLVRKLRIVLDSPASNMLTLGTSYTTFSEQLMSKSNSQTDALHIVDGNISDMGNYAIQAATEEISSQAAQTANEILTTVSKDYYLKGETDELIESINTRFEQTNDEFEFQFNKFSQDIEAVSNGADAQFSEIRKYIRFIDGNIVLGEDGNELTLKIQNDRISFLQNNAEVAYFSNRKMYVTDGEFLNSLTLGRFAFMPRANGNLSFKAVN